MIKKHFSFEEAKRVGEELGIDWSKFGVEQFRMGNESSDYYTRLGKMEREK